MPVLSIQHGMYVKQIHMGMGTCVLRKTCAHRNVRSMLCVACFREYLCQILNINYVVFAINVIVNYIFGATYVFIFNGNSHCVVFYPASSCD